VNEETGCPAYAAEGTPADCVKIALAGFVPGTKTGAQESFDVVVSGINWGANAGMNSLYSGTVAAALEGAYSGCLGVAVSLERGPEADFSSAAKTTRFILESLFKRKLPQRTAFSINIPARPLNKIKGIRISPQSTEFFQETLRHSSFPDGTEAITLASEDEALPFPHSRELVLLSQGYVTITPVTFDLTHRRLLVRLKKWPWTSRFQDFKKCLDSPL
jgi:5'-nucleotidase